MRKMVASVLAFVGAFLLVTAVLIQFYAQDRLVRTPIDADSTTKLSGTAQLTDGTQLNELSVRAWSITKGDSDKSDDDVAVFANSSCLVKDEGGIEECVSSDDPGDRLLSASTDNFATDRETAEAVNEPKYLPPDAEPHDGLINKWPFDAQKRTYPYWDGLVGSAVDAVYDRTATLDGLETYVYKVTIDRAPIEIAEGVPGTYTDDKELYIDPVTGSIIKQVDRQERLDADGEPALLLDLAFTDEQVSENVDDAEATGSQLTLITKTVPLIGFIVGIPLLIIGLVMLFLMNRAPRSPKPEKSSRVAAHA